MSPRVGSVSEEKAEAIAQEILAFEIGNLPYLGEPIQEGEEYVFPLHLRLPRVLYRGEPQIPSGVRFWNRMEVGEIRVSRETGQTQRTRLSEIEQNIRKRKRDVQEAVERALVRSSAMKFSRLPFPEHRYTPILDLLSIVILEGEITDESLGEMSDVTREKYETYLDMLLSVNLLRRENRRYTADDILIDIEREAERPKEQLNAALAHFFKVGTDNLETIRQILGPHLLICTYYYFKVLETGELPRLEERDFERALHREYAGENRVEKMFKLPRYLIQLEEVGLLQSVQEEAIGRWQGTQAVKQGLYQQDDVLGPFSEVFA